MQGYVWVCASLPSYLTGSELNEKTDLPHYKNVLIALGLLCAYGSWKGRSVELIDWSNEKWPFGECHSAANEARAIAMKRCQCERIHRKGCPLPLIGL